MSATGRGAARAAYDTYSTPPYCLLRLLEKLPLPGGKWLEPCAGDGRLVEITAQLRSDVEFTVCEIRPECQPTLESLPFTEKVIIGDFLSLDPANFGEKFAVCITNPPYSLAMEFIEKGLQLADTVVMLLRLNFMASKGRAAFFHRYPPDVYVLPNRPSFTGKGTDATDYCWMVFRANNEGCPTGRIQVLDTTPASERK